MNQQLIPYEVFTLSKLITCGDIELSAWSSSNKLLVLYVRDSEFIYFSLTEKPVIKQVPWFKDPLHTPVSIDFSPSGVFLLILSKSCNLYILPVLSLIDSTFRNDTFFDPNDLTIHVYPFSSKGWKNKTKTKSPNSSLSVVSSLSLQSSSSNSSLNDKPRSSTSSSSSFSDTQTNENLMKLKEILNTKCEASPSVVCWWQCVQNNQEIGIIGTKSGDIIFVDLVTGLKIGETNVKGEITSLSVCQDNTLENVFLLITVENCDQYKFLLEQRHLSYIWCGKPNTLNEDNDPIDNSNTGNGNYLPSARARLQGLKQMSAEKLASLKHKIVETRSKMGIKQGANEDISTKIYGPQPENLGSVIGDTMLSLQYAHEGNVLAGYYAKAQMLTVHTMNLDIAPMHIHKLPVETEDILLCDRLIYIVYNRRTALQVVSSKLTETRIDQASDFNQDAVLGKWDLRKRNEGNPIFQKSLEQHKVSLAKPDLIPDDLSNGNEERILNIYKTQDKVESCDVTKIYNLNKAEEELPNILKAENCIVVTNKNVYLVELKANMVKKALDFILDTHELEKAERICSIFGINIQKLLELAGDIKLAALEFPTAIALYKLSKCGLLKSIVKLACENHCSQVLSYSTMLMANSISDMSLTERIHLSNLMLMAYTQQILKNENNLTLMEKFTEFLKTNSYFDEVLAVSVTGQSLLFSCLRVLITQRGLILDGYKILIKLMERFLNSKVLEWSLNKTEFWKCAAETDLIEAMIINSSLFPIYQDYVSQHLDELEPDVLNRLLKTLDPTSPAISPVARVFKKDDSFDNDDTQTVFPFGKLIELFLLTLLIKVNKTRDSKEEYDRNFLLPLTETDVGDCSSILSDNESFGSGDTLGDEIWPIRKDVQGNEKFKKRVETILSCGYGHSALIRNGSVYTWGQTAKGCLGQGPTMSRYASPSPITWLSCFKLEVSVVSCGKYHTAALTNNGVYTWGCSKYGQLGLGEVHESPHPRLVTSLANENVVVVACGQYHTLALTNQGSVFAWGWGVHGQLGLGSINDHRHPKYVYTLKEYFIVDIAAGHGHSIVLTDKGHVYSFGSSVFGQLGTGSTMKNSTPILVKGINGRVVLIATGYFQNLALTDQNTLYTWGSSPQCLRFQAQARKRSRLLQNQNAEFEPLKTPEECQEQETEANVVLDKIESEMHLSPAVVDTSNVTGKIIQLTCGSHHSALLTDSGGMYTWGRSIDGQLGNGGHREVQIPTQINSNGFKADYISCGSEFTVAQEKHTGKVYCWGNNSLGQLAIPIKESTAKSLDGKLVMLKSSKRIVRLFDRNAASNSVDTPREIPEIPPPTFTYQTLSRHSTSIPRDLSQIDPEYSQKSLHFVVENFNHCINLPFILKKSLEYNNFQAASKISLLQNKCKQSIIYQLKTLQNLQKYHLKSASYLEEQDTTENNNSGGSKFYLFSMKDGQEATNNLSKVLDKKEENGKQTDFETSDEKESSLLQEEYMNHAKYILDSYLNLNSNQVYEDVDSCFILETGVQFWTAEKLPMSSLESYFLKKLDEVYYDFGYFLFCSQQKENQTQILGEFSSSFLFRITSKLLDRIENNESCVEYLETMSKLLTNDRSFPNATACRKKRISKRKKPKSETYLETIGENLKKHWDKENFIKISCGDVIGDYTHFFSCGHFYSANSLKEDFRAFDDIEESLAKKLMQFYEFSDNKNQSDLACPSCVLNYFKQ